jgi:para-aminobenzoate synthetase component 1
LILQKDGLITLYSETPEEDLQDLLNRFSRPEDNTLPAELSLKARITKNEYLQKLKGIQKAIYHGDIYELNFCQEFYNLLSIDPYTYFISMRDYSPSPFSVFMKYEDLFLLSVSPERFLMKEKSRIISQPIKGTISRGGSEFDDKRLKTQLLNSPKSVQKTS